MSVRDRAGGRDEANVRSEKAMRRMSGKLGGAMILLCLLLAACGRGTAGAPGAKAMGIHVTPLAEYRPDPDCPDQVRAMRAKADAGSDPAKTLPERYRDLRVIDAHNHGAAKNPIRTVKLHEEYFVDRTVLFGNISEPDALDSDHAAFLMYTQRPDAVYPFFAGIPLEEERGMKMAREKLEQGYFGMGEIVGASTYSPVTSKLAWKAQHPNSGILPEIYKLSAQYRAPVLLHIDPPDGEPIRKLEQALAGSAQAVIIFGHANAYNSPENIERLVSKYSNLYIDFFAGFTALNPDSTHSLADFVPLIETYPNQFVISTDSGYAVGEGEAIVAMYALLDLLSPEAVCSVSHQNLEGIIEAQPPTETQMKRIAELSRAAGLDGERKLNKRMANELILELEGKK